jgi:hypothetical protein
MQTEKLVTTIQISGKTIVFSHRGFTEEFDIESVLRIDVERLAIEILTFPVVLNRIGLLLAEADNAIKEADLDLEIWMAKEREKIRVELIDNKVAGDKLTQDDMKYRQEAKLKGSPVYLVKNRIAFAAKKRRDFVNSIFWSAKDKSDKLNHLASSLKGWKTLDQLLDEGLLNGSLNGVRIKVGKPLFED